MEIYLPDDPAALQRKLAARILPLQKSVICPDTVRTHAMAIRAELVGPGRPTAPLIMTGHQPLFYPPGILIKNMLAGTLARALGGSAVNLVVDTDEEELVFRYPVFHDRTASGAALARRESIVLNEGGVILGEQEWDPGKRERFQSALAEARATATRIFAEDRAGVVESAIGEIESALAGSRRPFDAAVAMRETFERENALSLPTVFVSDLVRSDAYRYFLKVIQENADDFRAAYNGALHEYRRARRIKNPAQPLPDLGTGELPFWVLKDGRRVALREEDLNGDHVILPRAVTLTLFARLFLCDLFIHGRGGARYDQITDKILKNFFDCDGAPYTVASATLALHPMDDFPLGGRTTGEIDRDLRNLRFDPGRFLPPDDELFAERARLIERFRAPGGDRAALHRDFTALRDTARRRLDHVHDSLTRERERAELVGRNRDVFQDREYPFFFYDLTPLEAAVRPFAELRLPSTMTS